jgi:hypothetical protein
VDDPRAADLKAAWSGTDIAGAAQALFAPDGVLGGGWRPDDRDLALMQA